MSARGWHRLLMRFALAAAHIFAWIGICAVYYQHSGNLAKALVAITLLYALTHAIGILLAPIAARTLRHGTRRALFYGSLAAVLAFAVLAYGFSHAAFLPAAITAFAIFMGLYRALYFTPYVLTTGRERTIRSIEILVTLAPALGGLVIASSAYSPAVLYSAASALIALSLVPAFFIPIRYEGFAWKYRETFHELVARKHRKLLGIAFLDGIEATALLFVWPIYVWTLVPFSRLGLIISITLLLGLCVRYYLRRAGWQPKPLHRALVEISASLLRITATSAVAVIAIDAYARSGANAAQRGIDIPTHEQTADNHTYLDEYSVLKDMGNGLGRIFLCLTVVAMAQASFQVAVFATFACAALASTLSLYLTRQHERVAF